MTPLARWVVLGAVTLAAAAAPPSAVIDNGPLRIKVYLPDARLGFYRGTRFDGSGLVGSFRYRGHECFGAWFQGTDPKVHDYEDRKGRIIAGLRSAAVGPAAEFAPVGFEEAQSGGTFLKIGVGILRRSDAAPYSAFRAYERVDQAEWTVERGPTSITFRQELSDPATGYACRYEKTVSLAADAPRMILSHRLTNTGTRPIHTTVYNHNFLRIDGRPTGPSTTVTLPFPIRATPTPDPALVNLDTHTFGFKRPLAGDDRVYCDLQGFGPEAKDYDLTVRDAHAGLGLRITGDRPMTRLALWSIRTSLSVEPYLGLDLAPGATREWTITYTAFPLKPDRR